MIRSSTHSLKFANSRKRSLINKVICEYRRLSQSFVDKFWDDFYKNNTKVPIFPTKDQMRFLDSWLSVRLKQACAKQTLDIIKGTLQKFKKQKFVYEKFNNRSLLSKIEKTKIQKPDCSKINLELDSRFIDFESSDNFLFVRVSSIGNKKQVKVPIKETKMSKKWLLKGTRKQSVRLTNDKIIFFYEVDEVPSVGNKVVAIDQGYLDVATLSDGQKTTCCPHGHTLKKIIKKLSNKQKGSKAFRKAQTHRQNYINWSMNQLNFDNCKEVRLEKVKNIRKHKRTSRKMSHWTYTLIKKKLTALSEDKGFIFKEVPNEFRSQRCNSCGLVRKANRKGKVFKCNVCQYENDADMNAALNLLLDLYEIPFWVRSKKINREGFYWKSDGLFSLRQERIVPVTENGFLLKSELLAQLVEPQICNL